MTTFKEYRAGIDQARAEVETISKQLDTLAAKRADYADRAETVKRNLAAAEDVHKTALKNFAANKGDEKAVTSAISKIVELELADRTAKDLVNSLDTNISELEQEKKRTVKRLAEATGKAYRALFAAELEKAAPLLVRLFAIYHYNLRATNGVFGTTDARNFTEMLVSTGMFKDDQFTTIGQAAFVEAIGTEPAPQFWKM